jgi:hypothetical protein
MAYEGDEDELRENRFSYLLQPIRDLAANWDIDIAAELEEYLDELDNITFTIEGCGPALNFAEAALLIQVCANHVPAAAAAVAVQREQAPALPLDTKQAAVQRAQV